MATSESDDFESADEEMSAARVDQSKRRPAKQYNSIGSDSDDDVDYIPVQYHTPMRGFNKEGSNTPLSQQKRSKIDKSQIETKKTPTDKCETNDVNSVKNNEKSANKDSTEVCQSDSAETKEESKPEMSSEKTVPSTESSKNIPNKRERPQRQRKPKEVQSLGAKKLGATKIDKLPDVETTPEEVKKKAQTENRPSPPLIQECWEECDEKNLAEELRNAQKKLQKENPKKKEEESEIPDELKSNLTFKDIFKPDGWEGLGEDVELPDDLSDDKYRPVLNKLASAGAEQDSTNGSWGAWGGWGVSSLLSTATAGVSTLTSHVSQGLSMLEETIGVPDPVDLVETEKPEIPAEKREKPKTENKEPEESPSQFLPTSFGFVNFMSSMSSISKLVESTSSKVISGGLDTLETIGKKTMEVLQEGDPGLRKKRAFLLNDDDKPILSQVLREAKEKADIEEKSLEEKELLRKVHLESLFDDYQGLVHLEALEMLSKQCNMKIQQQLVNVDGSELTSMQETLDEVKELCDLGDEDEEQDEEEKAKSLKDKLEEGCKDLGVTITYDKLIDIWNDMNSQISSAESKELSQRELYQKAISALAQFTAYSVERFHKTAELLLIKERRSTVNEADSLVQLTKTLSSQIESIAYLYCNILKTMKDESDKSEIKSSITTIFLEATNASSYVQEAFRLLIPILQVGAI